MLFSLDLPAVVCAWLLLLSSPLLLVLPRVARAVFLVFVPALALALLFLSPNGEWGQIEVLGQSLLLVRLDDIARIFVVMFLFGAVLAGLFAWSWHDRLQQFSAASYGGAAIAAVCAGDLLTLFIFWELVTIASTLLILAARTQEAYRAAFRYFMMQVLSGLALLSGLVLHTGGLTFDALTISLSGCLILLAFGVKAGFPLLNFWLPDAYPKATPIGTVFLSIFTTKLAVYALLRGFAGLEWLIYIGMVMALVSAVFAFTESNKRRILTYALNSQLGFMVGAIGIGSALALNGAIAHAFASIIYQALLFMVVASFLLERVQKFAFVFCFVGAASISGLPLFIGFTTKSITLSAAAESSVYLWLVLLAANAAAVIHTALRLPYLLFAESERVEAPSKPIFAAQALAAMSCLVLGVYPQALYALLPFAMSYTAFDFTHILQQVQLILFASFAFFVAFSMTRGTKNILLDLDWFVRGLPYLLYHESKENIAQASRLFLLGQGYLHSQATKLGIKLFHPFGIFASPQPIGAMALWIAIVLFAIMVLTLII